MMMLWSPRREWAGRADRRRPQLSVACEHERLFPGRAGHRTEVGAGQLQAASPVSQKGFWAQRYAVDGERSSGRLKKVSDRRLKKSSSRSEIGPASKERQSWETGLAGWMGGWVDGQVNCGTGASC